MFRPIGELAGNVMGELATKRSAGAASAEIGGEMARRENTTTSPIAQVARGLATSNSGMEKDRGGEAPASSDGGGNVKRRESEKATFDYGTHTRPALTLVMGGRELRSVGRRKQRGIPASALRNSLKLVVDNSHWTVSPSGAVRSEAIVALRQ